MPFIRPPLIKKRFLKLVLVTDNFKSTESSPRHAIYNKANSTLALYYRTKVTF